VVRLPTEIIDRVRIESLRTNTTIRQLDAVALDKAMPERFDIVPRNDAPAR